MLQAGDEIGRTQHGNNNAYCHDSELSWIDWDLDQSRQELLGFTKHLIRVFHHHPGLRRRKFFPGRHIWGSEVKDLTWFRPDGREMTDADWQHWHARCLGLRLAGDAIEEVDTRGQRIVDDTLLLLLNAHHESISFILPPHRPEGFWEVVLDTRTPTGRREVPRYRGSEGYDLVGRSAALLRLRYEPGFLRPHSLH
jgi:isoamylase